MRFALLSAACYVCVSLAASGCDRGSADGEAWFVEEGAARGIQFEYRSGFTDQALLPEIVGGGAALVDVDGDGDLDAYFVQSGWSLASGATEQTPRNELYRNDGSGRFHPMHEIGDAADPGYGMGVATGDYDNDGDVDLFVTNVGENKLFANDGSGRFTDVTARAGVGDTGWGTAALFADLDADGDLDLFVVNYLHWSIAVERSCRTRGQPTYCAPTAYDAPAMDRLYRNEGDGTFSDVSQKAGLSVAFGNGLGAIAEDFDGDGRVDLFVANDRLPDQLWMNRGEWRFVDEAADRGVAMDDNGVAKAGMGVASADVDEDGDADLLVVNFENETDSFYRNDGNHFVDVTARAGIAVASRRRTRFGVVLADFDNDGVVDLYEANGKVDGDPASAEDVFAEPNTLFRGTRDADGFIRFAEVPSRVDYKALTSRAAVAGDVDDDGRIDLLIVNRDAPATLLMNRASGGRSIRFRALNRAGSAALGAIVTIRTAGRERRASVRSATSYLAAHDPRVHFGLGNVRGVDEVSVRWPDGAEDRFGPFEAGATHNLRRQNNR